MIILGDTLQRLLSFMRAMALQASDFFSELIREMLASYHGYKTMLRSLSFNGQPMSHDQLDGSCPTAWCRSGGAAAVIFGQGRIDHAAIGGNVTSGSSLSWATLSSVM
jgi:hypothetical protein